MMVQKMNHDAKFIYTHTEFQLLFDGLLKVEGILKVF